MASSVGRGCSIGVLVAGLVFSGLCIPASADEWGEENAVTTEDSVNGESDVSSDESGNTEAFTGETNTGNTQSGSEINTSTGDGTSGEPASSDGGGLANGWGTSSWEVKDKVLHIGSGVTGPVSKSGGAPWRQNTSVTSVVFDDPENTVLNAQSAYLFSQMTNITSFEGINLIDTSQVINMEGMFYMSGVKNLDVSAWDVSNVTNMSYMFYGISLRSLDLSAWDTSSVTDMNSMFLGASFSSLDVSSWDTSSVTNMYGMFCDTYLTSLDVSSWDTSSVTDMGDMFLNANYLKTLDLSTWDVSNVTDMHRMFFVHLNVGQEDNVLESLDISGWDTSNVTNMDGMFVLLTNLRVLKLGEKTRLTPNTGLSLRYVWTVVGDGSIETPSGDWYGTWKEIALRDEANRAGTYVRLDPVVDDSFKVSSPMEDGSAYGRVVVSGRGTAGNTVHLNGISRFLGSTIIDADGTWSIVSPFPLSGALKLTATQIAEGQTTTRPVIFTAKPILEDTSGALKVVAPSNGNTIREETTATGGTVISGNAKPETTINITTTNNNTEGISDTVDANGVWSIVLGQKLLPGTHLLRITNTNTGTESGTDGVSGGLVSSVFVSDREEHIKVSIDTPTYGTTTDIVDGFVVVSGRGDVGASVVLYDHVGNEVGQETVVDANGMWSISLPLSNEMISKDGLVFFGAKQITTNNQVSVFETYTNTNTETGSVVPVRVTSPTTETSVSGTSTVFEGTGNPGSTISIHGLVRTLGTTTVDSDGKWQITSTIDLPRMYYQLFATQTTNNEQQTQTIYITTN